MATTAVVSSMSPVQPSRPNVIFGSRVRSASVFAPAVSSPHIDSVTINRSHNAVTLRISARANGLSKNSSKPKCASRAKHGCQVLANAQAMFDRMADRPKLFQYCRVRRSVVYKGHRYHATRTSTALAM